MQPPSCHRPWPWSCYTSTVHTGQAQRQAAQSPSRNLSPLPPTRKVLPRGIQQCGAVLGHTAAVTRHGVWHPSDHTQGPWKLAGTCAFDFSACPAQSCRPKKQGQHGGLPSYQYSNLSKELHCGIHFQMHGHQLGQKSPLFRVLMEPWGE